LDPFPGPGRNLSTKGHSPERETKKKKGGKCEGSIERVSPALEKKKKGGLTSGIQWSKEDLLKKKESLH